MNKCPTCQQTINNGGCGCITVSGSEFLGFENMTRIEKIPIDEDIPSKKKGRHKGNKLKPGFEESKESYYAGDFSLNSHPRNLDLKHAATVCATAKTMDWPLASRWMPQEHVLDFAWKLRDQLMKKDEWRCALGVAKIGEGSVEVALSGGSTIHGRSRLDSLEAAVNIVSKSHEMKGKVVERLNPCESYSAVLDKHSNKLKQDAFAANVEPAKTNRSCCEAVFAGRFKEVEAFAAVWLGNDKDCPYWMMEGTQLMMPCATCSSCIPNYTKEPPQKKKSLLISDFISW